MKYILWLSILVGSFAQASDDWVAKSNENAMVFLNAIAEFTPEVLGRIGVDGIDEDILDLKPELPQRIQAKFNQVITELKKRLKTEKHPAIRQDIEILLGSIETEAEDFRLKAQMIYGWSKIAESVFTGIQFLLDDQIPEERRGAALVRLKKYAGMAPGYRPIAHLAKERVEEQLAKKGLLWPIKSELEQYFGNSSRYLAGIEQLFEKYQISGYRKAFEALRAQSDEYNHFLKTRVLPHAREDFRLPPAIYENNLRQMGITISPEALIERSQVAFFEIIQEMNALAPLVAAKLGIEAQDYRDVLRELKKKQFEGDAILPHYRERNRQLEALIRKHGIVSLPKRDLNIRLASEAESARVPAPHMVPPRLLGNTGELGEFVLPLRIPSADGKQNLQFDDFCFEAASWTLSVHEARPGHELHFASIVEKGVSLPRILSFNVVNGEGWALYMEAVMKPYLPLEGQLISLQHRLLRAARAFLDPQLQLGLTTPQKAKQLLVDRVVISEALAGQEVERYTYRMPGQAPSYFFGYTNLMGLRTELELALGDRLDLKAYHDFVLAQGLLPHDWLRKAVLNEFLPSVAP